MQARFSQFRSPLVQSSMTRSKRSLSPFDNKLGSIVEEDESAERPSDIIPAKPKASHAPMTKRSVSQVRFSARPSNYNTTARRDTSNSLSHSQNRQYDNFFGYNRFTNQPSQLLHQRSVSNKLLEDELIRK